ncbi:hypothetical protein [Desulfolucanica intricata]|uniref:hypothetical protein n=1 Tax=Desulfolucanica intricata TaxID=1285191 RepID=UPI00082F9DB8|nr:hypothetical protein [Desulfolucanica intricata]
MEENILNLIGWDLSKTLEELRNAGWQAEVNFTCPIKGKPAGRARVIRLTRVAEKIVAVVAARQVLSEGGD